MLTANSSLGPYTIVKPIGSGGMGQVYEARDTRLGRRVAIKTVSGEFSDRFIREARMGSHSGCGIDCRPAVREHEPLPDS